MATVATQIETQHPEYAEKNPDWVLVEDGHDGERKIKQRTFVYLPSTSGQRALGLNLPTQRALAGGGTGRSSADKNEGQELYDAYLIRANYPPILKDTANALVGIMNREPPVITLPAALEDMEKHATARGEPLTNLIRRLQLRQLLFGRTGILADVDASRNMPYLVDYTARQIINWDDEITEPETAQRRTTLVVLDESRNVRDEFTWEFTNKFRFLDLTESGQYQATIEDDGARLDAVVPSIQGRTLDRIPFVFINDADLTPELGDIPLIGLARLALTIYRGDADYRQALFMQGQDTLVIIGETIDPDDPDQKLIVGSGAHINIPNAEGDAKFIGTESEGIPEMRTAAENDFERAANYGLQMMSKGGGAEAAETLKIKVAARTATLVNIAETSAAGLEAILRISAEWVGADPDEVSVEPNTDFIDEAMPAAELLGLMNAKSRGAPLSIRSIHAQMRKGDLTSLTFDDEQAEIDGEPAPDDRTLLGEDDDGDGDGDDDDTGNLPPGGNQDDDEDGDGDEE
ncbi:MAG: DUF4055 domain-containing protein [Hyphomicrobiaceae bacterium]|nr:DUF4055 domain-containing protein [Hyphomicrobiaceae bacterium]